MDRKEQAGGQSTELAGFGLVRRLLSLFGGKRRAQTKSELRFEKMSQRGYKCSTCGILHFGIMDLGIDHPNSWPAGLKNDQFHADNRFLLTSDLCVVDGQDFFVRCLLRIPIVDVPDQVFGYGIWSSLSEENFRAYADTFDMDQHDAQGPWFGWFSNSLPGYPETLNLKCQVFPQPKGSRPLIWLEPTDHPLAIEQRNGVTLDRLLEIYAAHGHAIEL